MILTPIPANTAEWYEARRGKVTASRIADMMAKTKSGWGASRANYAAQLVAERLTGEVAESYKSAAMEYGSELEPEARTAYEFHCDVDVRLGGFVGHPTIGSAGASPDGFVGSAGLVEFKCPNTATHIATLLGGSVPGKYVLQMQWQMECTDALWCDFVSYDKRMPESMRLFVARLERDQAVIDDLSANVLAFLAEINATVSELLERYQPRKAA
jgi:putative phage-type endonuclease